MDNSPAFDGVVKRPIYGVVVVYQTSQHTTCIVSILENHNTLYIGLFP